MLNTLFIDFRLGPMFGRGSCGKPVFRVFQALCAVLWSTTRQLPCRCFRLVT